jgi:hypothetical protein
MLSERVGTMSNDILGLLPGFPAMREKPWEIFEVYSGAP